MATFMLVHASFKGGWCWKQVSRLLRAEGHEVYTPTLTGLGERSHLADREVDLELHVQDILNVLFFEDLYQVILVGHSYAGMVITEVAARAPERISQLVYLDAYLPGNLQSEFDLWPQAEQALIRAELAKGSTNRMPPLVDILGIADQKLKDWMAPRLVPQPIATYMQPVVKGDAWRSGIVSSYILCTDSPLTPYMSVFADKARAAGWQVRELATGHDVMITAPATLAGVLDELAGGVIHPDLDA